MNLPKNINHKNQLRAHLCFICVDGDVMKWGDVFTTRVFWEKATFPLWKKKQNARKCKQCLQTFYAYFCCSSQSAQCKKEKHPRTQTQRIEGDALTEKHPVLLGVWPAALLSGEAHVCCCCVSGLSTGSGARTSCCCCCWLTDWSTGCWQAVAERVSHCALCLSRGIETRQLLACYMGGWSVCVSVLLTLLIVPLLQSLRRWETNTLHREADICSD